LESDSTKKMEELRKGKRGGKMARGGMGRGGGNIPVGFYCKNMSAMCLI